jgi:hypothetical protein
MTDIVSDLVQRLRPRRLPRRSLLVVAAVFCAVGAGSGIAAAVVTSAPADGAPVQLAPNSGVLPSLGSEPNSIVSAVQARVPDVASIQLSDQAVPNETGTATTQALVANLDVDASAPGAAGVAQAMWAGSLVGGALRTALSQARLTPPQSVNITLVRPDGSREELGGGIGKVIPNQVFNPVSAALQGQIKKQAASEGWTNVQISTFELLNDVVEIHATTADAAAGAKAFMDAGGLDSLLGESPNDFEGTYFELDDAQGDPILISTAAPRAGAWTFWADPSTGIQGEQYGQG